MQLKRCKQQHLLQRNIGQQRSKTNDHLIITKNMHTIMNFFLNEHFEQNNGYY
jgi:hypothetical protein